MRTQRRWKGFTLVEILVVVAIISVLAALLFTAFGRVQENGRATVCRSNLKQIVLAVQLYAQDNNGRLPQAESKPILHSYISSSTNTFSLFICPTLPDDSSGTNNSYVSNEQIVDFLMSHHREGKSESIITNPSTTWLNTEKDTFDPPSHSQPVSPAKGIPCGFTTTWHSGGANYSFVDGHVKWLLPESSCAIYNDNLAF